MVTSGQVGINRNVRRAFRVGSCVGSLKGCLVIASNVAYVLCPNEVYVLLATGCQWYSRSLGGRFATQPVWS